MGADCGTNTIFVCSPFSAIACCNACSAICRACATCCNAWIAFAWRPINSSISRTLSDSLISLLPKERQRIHRGDNRVLPHPRLFICRFHQSFEPRSLDPREVGKVKCALGQVCRRAIKYTLDNMEKFYEIPIPNI